MIMTCKTFSTDHSPPSVLWASMRLLKKSNTCRVQKTFVFGITNTWHEIVQVKIYAYKIVRSSSGKRKKIAKLKFRHESIIYQQPKKIKEVLYTSRSHTVYMFSSSSLKRGWFLKGLKTSWRCIIAYTTCSNSRKKKEVKNSITRRKK